MCRVVERYPDGSEQTFEGVLLRTNGHVVLGTKNGVVEIPKSRVKEIKQTPQTENRSPHEA
jgi:hypothetical protein